MKREAPLADCAILYRSNAQSRIMEEAPLQRICLIVFMVDSVFERQEIKDAPLICVLTANRHDDASLNVL